MTNRRAAYRKHDRKSARTPAAGMPAARRRRSALMVLAGAAFALTLPGCRTFLTYRVADAPEEDSDSRDLVADMGIQKTPPDS